MRICGVKVGKQCYVGFNVVFDTNYPSLISIGSGVTISHNVAIYTHTATSVRCRLAGVYNHVAPVTIANGSWISANCVILPGASIGSDCMIGAGAVVVGHTEPRHLYAGNPARKVKPIDFEKMDR